MDLEFRELERFKSIIGCDEVGRGPLAGPVNACAVRVQRKDSLILEKLKNLNITDSKKLSVKKRQNILQNLKIDVSKIELNQVYTNSELGYSFAFCICEHDHHDIDLMNILQASLSAMKTASDYLVLEKSKVLIDGNKAFKSEKIDVVETQAIVKGDSKVLIIALASIIAKEYRDQKMKILNNIYPGYNLDKHAGYPTKEHRDAIKRLGPSTIHRKTFKGVKEFWQ